eukprot:4328581-Pleurochrysis_carterae.AAC.1
MGARVHRVHQGRGSATHRRADAGTAQAACGGDVRGPPLRVRCAARGVARAGSRGARGTTRGRQ